MRPSTTGFRYVSPTKDRHGKTRYRFQKRGYKARYLPDINSPEFLPAYTKALESITQARQNPEDTFDRAVDKYYACDAYKSLKPVSKLNNKRRLQKLCRKYGQYSIRTLKREHIVKILGRISSPNEKNRTLTLFKLVLQESVEQGVIETNVAATIKRAKHVTNGFKTWTRKDIQQFLDYHERGSMARLALLLLYYTGQRSGDVSQMGAANINEGRVTIKQSKTGARIDLPLHAELKEEIPERHIWLVTPNGKPFAIKGFQQWFVRKCKEADLHGLSAHGLRKALATHLAEAGATVHEIQAVTGHKTVSEVQRYIAEVNKGKLADEAFRKLG